MLALLTLLLAQADAEIPPVDPEIERASFVLPDGFTAELWAADPMIAKPIQMNFAPDGKLWVATSRTYPQVKPGEVGEDEIVVLEDTDSDGRADSRTVFADGLLIPTGVAPGDGGCYVANSTELLHLSDTDGDGRADRRSILLSGFGTEDTHHLIHTFRWDPACRLNFAQSIYIHSHVETPFGVERLNAGGVWVFRPDRLHLDVFAYGLINPWGLAWTETGQTFATDGAGGEGINWMLPGGYYKTAANAPRLLAGLNPGSPKHCGLEVVDGPTLPDDFQGSHITCDFRGHRVCRFEVTDEAAPANLAPSDPAIADLPPTSAGWRSREVTELIRSDFPAFRPIDVKQGPDGALYIADWYNPIIQHGEVDFRDPRRDKTHGRIWRVTYDGRATEPVDYSSLPPEDLFATLASDWSYARRQARRVLVERIREEPSVREQMTAWVRALDNSQPNYWRTRLQTLWITHGLGDVDPFNLDLLLRCNDADVRAAAFRVLGDQSRTWRRDAAETLHQPGRDNPEQSDPWLAALELGVSDLSPRVRLEAVRIAPTFRSDRAAAIAMQALDHPVDEWIDYALFLTVRETADGWLPRVVAGESVFAKPSHRLYALRNAGRDAAIAPTIELLATVELPGEERVAILEELAARARVPELVAMIDAAGRIEDDAVAAELFKAVRGAKRVKSIPKDRAATFRPLAMQRSGLAGLHAASLLAKIGITDADLTKAVADRFGEVLAADGDLGEAIEAVIAADNPWLVAAAVEAIEKARGRLPDDALVALARSKPGFVAARVANTLADESKPQPDDPARVVTAVLNVKGGVPSLNRELGKVTLPADRGRTLLAAVRSSGQSDATLLETIARVASLEDSKRTYSAELVAKLRDELAVADPAHGEAIYRDAELACQKCHAIGGAGGVIGPEMRSLGAASPLEYIVESLLAPSARIKEGYNAVVVLTIDGELVTGVPISQTDDAIVLRDANGKRHTIAADDIEQQKPADSLMPAGLVDRLTDRDFRDLVAFLAALGKQEHYTIRPDPIVRTAEAMTPDNKAAYLLRRQRYAAAATDPDQFVWTSVYSRVDGSLPVESLPLVEVKNRSAAGQLGVSFVRVRFRQLVPGPLAITIDGDAVSEAWVDGQPVDLPPANTLATPDESSSAAVAAGEHTLTAAILRADDAEAAFVISYDPERAAPVTAAAK